MSVPRPNKSPGLEQAFADYERDVTIQNYRVGCVLGIVFMPAGSSLDYFVYPYQTLFFFELRLCCSLLLGCIWALLKTTWGRKFYRALGLIEVSLPIFFISGMIYVTEGPSSPYYAGLNLVLMGAGIVLRWSLQESIAVLLIAMGMYLIACIAVGVAGVSGIFFNNVYFLFVTGVFIITGNYVYNRIRFREFELRFELDQSRTLLAESNRKLVELDQVKSRFFANISHELRTPLTLLLAPLEALLQGGAKAFEPDSFEMLQTMHANGMRLLKLINDLLDLVRLESGKLVVRREPLEIGDFIRGLGMSIQKVAQDKGITLQTTVDPRIGTIMTDRDKLERILLNLLFNAIKFTPSGGRIVVSAESVADDLVMQIRDTGMGISAEHLPFIFDRFWQVDTSSQRKYQGAGIGLALVKELVEVQDGSVSVESSLGKGTTMKVRLPLVRAVVSLAANRTGDASALETPALAGAPPPPPPQPNEWLAQLYRRAELFPALNPVSESVRRVEVPAAGALPLVLIADDEPAMLRFLKSQLSRQFRILEAVDGLQAIQMASQFLPDVLLCDMMMPEQDGLQVCRELRKRTPTQNLPIVLLTARADDETKLAALAAGASDFLTKPFSSAELHVRLANLVESNRLQRELVRQNKVLKTTLDQLKETESQLVQSEKMASLGRMSAGIMHEINNPLNFVKTGLYALKKRSANLADAQKSDFEEILRDVEEGVDRVRTIVTDLRTFSHPNQDQFETVEVGKVIASALRFLAGEWKDVVRIENHISEHLTLWAHRNKLTLVLVNLLQNALDALKLKTFQTEAPTIWIESQVVPGKTRLIIRDNGPGIAGENLEKIFEPFFTTKEVGEGMGLGLSMCYRVLAEHKGRISVRSEPGKFCEFELVFPEKV